ncbi:DUF4199 domain-containing protein [uncultured Flavobacterium sp.]|uniref:DUF4199 domain-containing protein n=1 Tax=uncultured Flavobacterium sp. TaxID=165435 RepID=UPI0025EABB60|nr:DUF4199 domain-containing protein [uncultured Flavobacterium sp.]
MKKTIWINGLIGGLIVAVMMVASTFLSYRQAKYEASMALTYLGMLLAFCFVFVGVKSFRDKHNSGVISFGQAFKIGFLIALIASSIYVLVWLVEYYFFIPDFMEKYTAEMMKQFSEANHTAAEIQAKTAELDGYKEMYKNPILVIGMTYMEILPIGIVLSLIAALVFKRKA